MPEPTPPTGPAIDISSLPRKASNDKGRLQRAIAAAEGNPQEPEPVPAVEPAKPTTEPKAAQEPVKIVPKEAPKASEQPAPPETPTKPPKSVEALREAYDRQAAKVDEITRSLTATSAEKAEALRKQAEAAEKLAKAEERIKDLEPRASRLVEVEKELQQREELIRTTNYTQSREWHEKYVKPLADTRTEAIEQISQLVITDEAGNQRQATERDFEEVLAQPNLTIAAKVARQKFGDEMYQTVVNYTTRVRSLARAQRDAYDKASLEAQEYYKNQEVSESNRRKALHDHLMNETKRFMESEPEFFRPPENDNEAISALAEGQRFIELLANGSPDMPQEKLISEIAKGRARIVKSFRQDQVIKNLKTEVEALKSELGQFRRSEPEVKTRSDGGKPIQSEGRAGRLERALKMAG